MTNKSKRIRSVSICESDDVPASLSKTASASTGTGRKQEHNYHDYSRVAPAGESLDTIYVTRGGVPTLFPLKLYSMLRYVDGKTTADIRLQHAKMVANDETGEIQPLAVPDGPEELKELTSIVSWQPHGRAFKVHDPKAFKAYFLPHFFGKMKYSSFLRQLNLYGFTRLSVGEDKGGYYHELFLQHREYLVYRINRIKVKGSGTRAAANPEEEPIFYKMAYMCDIPIPSPSEYSSSVLPSINPSLISVLDLQREEKAMAESGNTAKKSSKKKGAKRRKTVDCIKSTTIDHEMNFSDLYDPVPLSAITAPHQDLAPAFIRRVSNEEPRCQSPSSFFFNESNSTLDFNESNSTLESFAEDPDLEDLDLLQNLLQDMDTADTEGDVGDAMANAIATDLMAADEAARCEPCPVSSDMVVADEDSKQVLLTQAMALDNEEINFLQSIFTPTSASSNNAEPKPIKALSDSRPNTAQAEYLQMVLQAQDACARAQHAAQTLQQQQQTATGFVMNHIEHKAAPFQSPSDRRRALSYSSRAA